MLDLTLEHLAVSFRQINFAPLHHFWMLYITAMRLLKILTTLICLLVVSPQAFAQSESLNPKFSFGFSIGLPTSVHFSARDIGVRGFEIRADAGGILFFLFGYAQLALNLEYHFAEPREVGFYFGLGLVALKTLVAGEFSDPNGYPWKFGGQGYVGIDLGPMFIEFGAMQLIDAASTGFGVCSLELYLDFTVTSDLQFLVATRG